MFSFSSEIEMAENQEYSSGIHFEYVRILADQNNLITKKDQRMLQDFSAVRFSLEVSIEAKYRILLVQEKTSFLNYKTKTLMHIIRVRDLINKEDTL